MNRIRECRKQKNMTLKDLSKVLGVTEGAVSSYELGVRNPDNETLIKIAKYFNVSLDYLLCLNDQKQNKEQDQQQAKLNKQLVNLLVDLTDNEEQLVKAYIAGMKANRK